MKLAHAHLLQAIFAADFVARWMASNGILSRRAPHVRAQLDRYFTLLPAMARDTQSPDFEVAARAYSRLAHGV